MAFYDTVFYLNFGDGSTTGYYAVTVRPQNAAVAAGVLRRQFTAPAVGNERVFVCIVAGTTANTTDATWTLTRGAKVTDGTATWQECTGLSAVNGDATNTVNWTQAKVIGTPTLGAIIKRNNGASYQICTTAGSMAASEPAFSDTAGVTTSDGTSVWTSLGVVGNFTGGQAPHARLVNVFGSNWWASGNTVYVGNNHAESGTTTITITPINTTATAAKIICHNHSGAYPPGSGDLSTTASFTASTAISLNGQGLFYYYGLIFAGPAPANMNIVNPSSYQTPGNWQYFDNCSFQPLSGANGGISVGPSSSFCVIVWNNCTVKLGTGLAYVALQNCFFTWQNTGSVLASGSSVPSASTSLLMPTVGKVCNVILEALDLSQLSAGIISNSSTSNDALFTALIRDCKVAVGSAIVGSNGVIETGSVVQTVRSDSGATAYKSARYVYEGTETTETTITRVGGATDPTGQAQSRKIVTTANAQWLVPFKAEPSAIWNPTTGSNVTVTIYGTVNSYYLPFNDEIWLEVEYLGASGSPLGTIVTSTKSSVLASNLPVAADDSVWNGVSLLAAGADEQPSPRTIYMIFDGAPTSVTLSNGNLTVTHPNTSIAGVNSADFAGPAVGQLGVKQYFEVTLQTSITNGNSIGYMTPTDATTAAPASGNNKTGVILGSSSSIIYTPNGVSTGKDLGAVAVNDVISGAYDGDNSLLWFRKNGGNWNGDASANQATGAGGVFAVIRQGYTPYVAFASGGPSTDVMKGNFGQTTFAFTAPSGFGAPSGTGGGGGGGTAGWSSFKLVATLSSPQPGLAGYIHARVRVGKASATYYIDPKVVLS